MEISFFFLKLLMGFYIYQFWDEYFAKVYHYVTSNLYHSRKFEFKNLVKGSYHENLSPGNFLQFQYFVFSGYRKSWRYRCLLRQWQIWLWRQRFSRSYMKNLSQRSTFPQYFHKIYQDHIYKTCHKGYLLNNTQGIYWQNYILINS